MDVLEILPKAIIYNTARYFLVAGGAFLVYYVIFRSRWSYKKIQQKYPANKDYIREISYSVVTLAIFISVAVLVYTEPLASFNQRYDQFEQHGWGYWVLSIIIMIFMHDTYFYWIHRGMHHPKIYKYVHKVHHLSQNPSPWAAYAFHPIEAFFEASIIFPIVFLVPHHRSAVLVFLSFMIFYNVYGHLGYELFPKRFNKNPIGKWLNTSINHNQHHEKFHGNYGLYFLFWDRLLGTIRDDYDEAYAKNDLRRESEEVAIKS